jgi:hypothetical protein
LIGPGARRSAKESNGRFSSTCLPHGGPHGGSGVFRNRLFLKLLQSVPQFQL